MDVVRFDKQITMSGIPTRPSADEPRWARWSDERLLDLRFCDLKLSIAGTPLEMPGTTNMMKLMTIGEQSQRKS